MKKALFAGGCFWCMQPPYDQETGVVGVSVGFSGGDIENPSYELVCTGATGHYEVAEITYDPKLISYERLLEIFWQNIDPTNPVGQFADVGSHYRTAIFYSDSEQEQLAIQSRERLIQSGKFDKDIVTDILPAKPFYSAEEYHQGYYLKNRLHYNAYKHGSGRAAFIDQVWNK